MKRNTEYAIQVEQLVVGYQKKSVVKNINFSLKKGQILTLIGPNGAGKSTILKSIAKQLDPLSGEIFLKNQNQKEYSGQELSQNLAVVFTDKMSTEMMTCRDVVETGRYPYTGHFGILKKEDRSAVEEAIRLVHIEEIAENDFSKISDGQRQRVLLARAICQEPEILILDEPTSFLDIRYKVEFLSILQKLTREKEITVIMSLHELELAERVSDYVLCVKSNHVDKVGTPDEIFSDNYISQLYDLVVGSHDTITGNVELDRPTGNAGTFLITSGKCKKQIFYKLQRENIAFYAGIFMDTDIAYHACKYLAKEAVVIAAEDIDWEQGISKNKIVHNRLSYAKKIIDQCDKVIIVGELTGPFKQINDELYKYAKEKKITLQTFDC